MNKRERISDFVRSLEPVAGEEPWPDYYAAFFQLWNAQKYYEAHDVLEQLWLVEENVELARFYKALIQAAGAFVHLQKNFEQPLHAKHGRRIRPATRLLALALRNLEELPDEFHGFDVTGFRELLARWCAEITARQFEKNPWSPQNAPRLSLRPPDSIARSTKSRRNK
jgi:predicted metal-dependent hydrolase